MVISRENYHAKIALKLSLFINVGCSYD